MGLMERRAIRRALRNMDKKKPSFAEEWKKLSRLDKFIFLSLYSVFVYFLFRYFLGIDLITLFRLIVKRLLTGL